MHNRNGHPCYRGSKAWKRRTIRNQAKRLLSSGPWFWPRDPRAGSEQLASTHLTEEEAALQRALDVCERGPNQLRPGRALLLTVDGAQNEEFDNGSLLTVELRPEDERNTQSVPLKDNARKAWSYASIAVTHAVDMLWKSTDGLEQKVPTLNRVEGISSTIELADGASFGLAFALAIVSDLLDQSLPVDVAATARFANEWTRLGPVGGLEAKLSAVAQYALSLIHI